MQKTANVGTYEKQQQILSIISGLTPGGGMPKRYTVKIDKNNSDPTSRIEYIHDAVGMTPAAMNYSTGQFSYGDWGDMWFIKGNYPVMLKSNGTVDYKLSPTNHAYKEDGSTASDVANTSYDGNAMARFPKVYLSFWETATHEYISVCEEKYDETYEPIGFINDNGDEVDEIFLAMYQGSQVSSKLRSLSGQWPIWKQTAATEISYAQANGTGWYTRTWAQRQMVNALLTIISKSDDSQTAFGGGVNNTYVNNESQHYGMKASGGLNTAGQFFGYNDGTHQVKVFFMEDWWGNQWERIAGVINDNGTMKVAMHGPYDTTGAGAAYKTIYGATPSGTSGGYIAKCVSSNDCGRLPVSTKSPAGTEGSASTFLTDGFLFNNTQVNYLVVGGGCGYELKVGVSYFAVDGAASNTSWAFGASLSYIAS